MARCVDDVEGQAGELQGLAVGQLDDSSGSAQVAARPNCCSSICSIPLEANSQRVDQPFAVVGVHQGQPRRAPRPG